MTQEESTKIAKYILRIVGLLCLNAAAWHFGGIYGVLIVAGLLFRDKL